MVCPTNLIEEDIKVVCGDSLDNVVYLGDQCSYSDSYISVPEYITIPNILISEGDDAIDCALAKAQRGKEVVIVTKVSPEDQGVTCSPLDSFYTITIPDF